MKILVLDTMIQTVDFTKPVRGGLVKAVWNDVIALSERHEVFYAYYGKATYDYKFTSVILGKHGAKDWCLKNKKKASLAHHKLKSDIPLYLETIASIKPDVIVVNVESKSQYLVEIAKKFIDVPKLYIYYDGVSNNDMFGTAGIIGSIIKLKKYNSIITTISEYTRDSITAVMIKRESDMRKHYDFMKEIKDVNDYQLFDDVLDYFVYYDNNAKLDIVNNEGFSVNIGRYQKKKGVLNLLKLHQYNNHRIKLYGVKDPVWDVGLESYKKIVEACETYDNYQLCEAYTDEELREDAKAGNNIVISCTVEGFGYTAFEMGVYGMPTIILKSGERHATEEYLKKVGASYVVIDKLHNTTWKEELYHAMLTTKLNNAEKRENAQKLLDYFTLDNYIDERERFFEMAINEVKNNKTKKLF